MRSNPGVGLSLVLTILGSGWVPSKGADSAAETVLKLKGLTESVHTYVIEDEKPALAKMKELRGRNRGVSGFWIGDQDGAAQHRTQAED